MNTKLTFLATVALVFSGTMGCMDLVGIDPDSQLGGICGDQPSEFASGQDGANYLAVDATNLYWTNRYSGEVMKKPVEGGKVEALYTQSLESQPRCIVVDGNSLFWTNVGDGTVMMGDIDGGPSTRVAWGQDHPYDIAVNDQFVYWTNEGPEEHKTEPIGTVMRRRRDLSEDAEVFASGQTYPQAIAVDGMGVFWTSINKVKYALAGGEAGDASGTNIATSPPTNSDEKKKPTLYSRMVIKGKTLYWTDTDSNTVNRVDAGGGNQKTIAANTLTPFGIAVDETNVYFTSSHDHFVSKVGLGGGEVNTIATGQSFPVGIVVDKTCIYWANREGNTMMMVAK